jgi:hypothetical protein
MPTNQTNFFATYNDISSVLEQFERGEREGILYVLSGLFNVETPQILETYRALNSLSVSVDGDPNHVSGYLIVSDPKQIVVTEVPQKKGGSKFGIDQAGIPDSLYFQSGGVFGNEIIVPGRIGIVYQTPISRRLYGTFAKLITRNFIKVKSYYVGPEAYALWKNGMRLGLSIKASPEIDLKQ